MSRMHLGRWAVFATYVVAMLVSMLVPVPSTPWYLPTYFDKLVHVGLFFGLVVLAAWAAGASRRSVASIAWIVVLAVGLAGLVELVQIQLPYRTGDVRDFAAGVAGALAGAVVIRLARGFPTHR